MTTPKDRILIVESNPEISDFIGRQSLASAGYQVFTVSDASNAISKILQIAPDLIITDLKLPGLSGKDLMVALSSQGINIPVIVVAQSGQESEVIQTFRLGAEDYLIWPCQEPEIIRSVERIIQKIHEHRERSSLEKRLSEINLQLQQRVRELTAIFSMGKAVTSITDQRALFEKINHVAAQVCQADISWFLLREEEKEKKFLLVAQQNLPASLADNLMKTWDDGVSSLVVISGEPLRLHGNPMQRFRVKTFGQSILIVPIKVQRQVMGILVAMRKQPNPFSDSDQHLLEAVADYASISLVNARLFRAIEARAQALQDLANHSQGNEKITQEKLLTVERNLGQSSKAMFAILEDLSQDTTAQWTPAQRKNLTALKEKMVSLDMVTQTIVPLVNSQNKRQEMVTDLAGLAADMEKRFAPIAQQYNLAYRSAPSAQPVRASAEPTLLHEVLQGLITNAIQFCQENGEVILAYTQTSNNQCQIDVSNSGLLNIKKRDNIFKKVQKDEQEKMRFAGIGISLELIQEIVQNLNGKIWADQNEESKTAFHILLPLASPKT